MEMRNIGSLEEIIQAITPGPDVEEMKENLQKSLARIRDAFEPTNEEDHDARLILEFVNTIMEPSLAFLVADWDDVSDPVRLTVGETAKGMSESFRLLDGLADVRLRAQGRYYEIETSDPDDVTEN